MKKSGKKKVRSKKRRGLRSISTKILMGVGGAVVVSFVVLIFIVMQITSNSVTELRDSELNAQSQSAANDIDAYFVKYFEMVNSLSQNGDIRRVFNEATGDMKMADTSKLTFVRENLAAVKSVNSDALLSVWIVDIDTSQIADDSGFMSDSGWDVNSRPWFAEVTSAGETVLTEPYEDTSTKKQVISVIAPVFKSGTKDIIGVTGVDLTLDKITEKISSYKLGDTGYFILMTAGGQVIYHPVAEYNNKNIADTAMSDNFKTAITSHTLGSIHYTLNGAGSHGYIAPVGETSWMVATGLPDKEYNQAYTAIRTTMLIIFIAALLIVIVIILLVSRQIVTPIKKLTLSARLIAEGNLDVAVDTSSSDETGQMSEALNQTVVQLRRYTAYIGEITRTLEAMAQGDMRIHLEEDYVGEFASIKTAFGDISSSLNHALHLINDTAEQVSVGADQVSHGAQALSAGSTEQAASIQELSASVMSIADQAVQNSEHVRTATQYVTKTGTDVAAGNEHMIKLTDAMSEISSSSGQIANITKVIEDIAFQTNILALNAAIEAARAGEAGKGFAVVADEVRTLAAKSAEAAKQTADLIHSSVSTVSRGTQITAETAKILLEVGESTDKVTESFTRIEQASAEQSDAIEQVKEGLSQVSAVVQTNAATAEENSATSEEMSAQAVTLRGEVGRFKLEPSMGNTEVSTTSHWENVSEENTSEENVSEDNVSEDNEDMTESTYDLGKY